MEPLSWMQKFQISPQEQETWTLKPGQSALCYALEKGFVEEKTLLQWASQHHGVGILPESYFSSHTPPTNLLEKYKHVDTCVPIGEWEGLLIVAALLPSEELTEALKKIDPRPVQLVLCGFTALQTWRNAKGEEVKDRLLPAPSSAKHKEQPPKPPTLREELSSAPNLNEEGDSNRLCGKHPPLPPSGQASPKQQGEMMRQLQECADTILQQWEGFDRTMLLLLSGEQLQPWRWHGDWSPKEGAGEESVMGVDVAGPSFFRVAWTTRDFYHGYVPEGDINGIFFKNWTEGKYPEHVTAYPLIYEGRRMGVILGLASHVSAQGLSLEGLKQLGDQLAQTLSSRL